ncbi:amidohydrolase family protein [Marinobacter sp. Arc7-DN-1]|uniref:amidohydrolase family protein n=1 Tax=Marinobacter sp. Arc7-DN-1 TaxID=2304594 RepID=UPI000E43677B|nr:amidohydrolase family protein [Marinobacter sp. Arc7-DN-1]AXS84926.1 GntR family transcriptional regulator [Marinobacter sp. Arc7-DN-1]
MFAKPDIPGPNPWVESPQEKLPEGACDTHAHLFGPQEAYPYQTKRGYTPPDATETSYRNLLQTLGFQRAVLVQPSVYGTDNRLMLDTLSASTDSDPIDWRGVAVVDRHISDEELSRMDTLGVRGIRINLVFPGGVTFEDIVSLAARIKVFGWHIQFLVDVSKFENLAERLDKLPVPSVVDHMGHLSTRLGIANPGFRELLDLMAEGRTWVKLTGPNRLSTLPEAPFTDVDPFFQALREARQDRCLFGTDWPHVQLPTPMPFDHSLVNEFIRLVPDVQGRQAILVDNPANLYGF